MKETHIRTLVKSITWRTCATITTIILVYIFTKSITMAVSLGIVEVITKLIIYYGHERVWQRVRWGTR